MCQMRRFAFDDHNPPTMKQIMTLCQNALDFMQGDSRNRCAASIYRRPGTANSSTDAENGRYAASQSIARAGRGARA